MFNTFKTKVLILDGNSEIGAPIWREIRNVIFITMILLLSNISNKNNFKMFVPIFI